MGIRLMPLLQLHPRYLRHSDHRIVVAPQGIEPCPLQSARLNFDRAQRIEMAAQRAHQAIVGRGAFTERRADVNTVRILSLIRRRNIARTLCDRTCSRPLRGAQASDQPRASAAGSNLAAQRRRAHCIAGSVDSSVTTAVLRPASSMKLIGIPCRSQSRRTIARPSP